MFIFKSVIIITLVSFLNVSCATTGGLRQCGGAAAVGALAGALVGVAADTKDRARGAIVGGSIGAVLGGIACALNQQDRENIQEALSVAPPAGGQYSACLNERGLTRGIGVQAKPEECPQKGPLGLKIGASTREGSKVCREYSTELPANGGQPVTEKSKACRGPDGKWQDVNT